MMNWNCKCNRKIDYDLNTAVFELKSEPLVDRTKWLNIFGYPFRLPSQNSAAMHRPLGPWFYIKTIVLIKKTWKMQIQM